MKAAFARSYNPCHKRKAQEPADTFATPCSSCGEVILAIAGSCSSALVELSCNRCGLNDVYHVNSLRPISRVNPSGTTP